MASESASASIPIRGPTDRDHGASTSSGLLNGDAHGAMDRSIGGGDHDGGTAGSRETAPRSAAPVSRSYGPPARGFPGAAVVVANHAVIRHQLLRHRPVDRWVH